MQEQYEDTVNFTIGINDLYTQNIDEYNVIDIKVAKQAVSKELKKIENASVHGVYLSQKPITGVITSRFGSRESIRS